jgi:hypothetical protein
MVPIIWSLRAPYFENAPALGPLPYSKKPKRIRKRRTHTYKK